MKKLLVLIALFIPLLAFAHGPTPQKVEQEIAIDAPPAKVWAIIKDFANWQTWHPDITKITTETRDGELYRTITLKSGGTILEKFRSADETDLKFKYEAEEGAILASDYVGTITVKPGATPNQSSVLWFGRYYRLYKLNPPIPEGQDDESANKAVGDFVNDGLTNLKKVAEGK